MAGSVHKINLANVGDFRHFYFRAKAGSKEEQREAKIHGRAQKESKNPWKGAPRGAKWGSEELKKSAKWLKMTPGWSKEGPNAGKDGRRERPEEEDETKNQSTRQRREKERRSNRNEGKTKKSVSQKWWENPHENENSTFFNQFFFWIQRGAMWKSNNKTRMILIILPRAKEQNGR